MTNNIIVYHDQCNDGMLSALLYKNYLKTFTDETFELRPTKYSDQINLNDFKGSLLVMVDFSFKENLTKEIIQMVKNGEMLGLTILDHHKTFKEVYDSLSDDYKNTDNVDVRLKMERSGVGMTFEYISEQLAKTYPHAKEVMNELWEKFPIFKCIEDNDIWTHKYGALTDQIANGFYAVMEKEQFDYQKMNQYMQMGYIMNELLHKMQQPDYELSILFQNLNKITTHIQELGQHIINERDKKINVYYQQAQNKKITIDDETFKIKLVKINPTDKDVVNKLGEKIYSDNQTVALMYYEADGLIRCSMRSSQNIDCSKIAKKFGGGGHQCAAAFTMGNIIELNNIFDNNKNQIKIKPA